MTTVPVECYTAPALNTRGPWTQHRSIFNDHISQILVAYKLDISLIDKTRKIADNFIDGTILAA